MKFSICPDCGAHLDHGERCDCGAKREPPPVRETEDGKGNQRMITHNAFYHSADQKSTEEPNGL